MVWKKKRLTVKKIIRTGLLVLSVFGCSCLTGCSNTDSGTAYGTVDKVKAKIYNGQTVIHTPRGNWTPPKGARRLDNGTIVDSDGVVIGNDGTWHDDGEGVG